MRVVAHACSNTEIVCALGCAGMLVGVDDHSDHPPDVVRALPRVGPDLQIDVDKVAALRPDLVIYSLTIPGHERSLDALRAAGIPTLVLEPVSFDDVLRDIRTVGDALGVPERAARLADDLDAATPAVPALSRPSVLVEWWPKPVITPGRRSWVTDLLARAGGRNPFGDRDAKSSPVTDAEVQAAAPDAVAIAWCGVPERKYRPEVVARRPGWADVPAVKNRRIAPISEAWLGRPGPRLAEGYRRLRALIEAVRDPA